MTMRIFSIIILGALFLLLVPGLAWAAEAPKIDTGDTTFIIISTALVMLMTPGLALFYGGMVRKKNVLSTLMHSFFVIALVSVQWVLIGYTLAFGSDISGFIGSLDMLGLKGVAGGVTGTIPTYVFVAFQLMFAIITTAIISGAFAERMRFPAFILFSLIWVTVIYAPLAHWVWGGGWIFKLGALDFAGGTVVHISSGVAGLVTALVLGKRRGHGTQPMVPHQLPMTLLGACLLWFGWFGFNAGSALTAGELAGNAFIVTNTAAAAAVLSWLAVEWLHRGKPTALGAATGAVAGLVAITPAAGFVTPLASIVIGLVGGVVCYFGVAILKAKLGYDDALDAFGCHGIGGTWGAIATGLFATKTVNAAGNNGLFYGNSELMVSQLISVVAAYAFVAIGTFGILKIVGVITPLRATAEEEEIGLDITQHGEEAYSEYSIGGPVLRGTGTISSEKVGSSALQS
ncbi:MAG: ammonium transporter [Thermincolia bacterium]